MYLQLRINGKQLIQCFVTVGQAIQEFKWEMYIESMVISVAYFYRKEGHKAINKRSDNFTLS